MEITPKIQTLAQLFQPNGDDKYIVPVYQRNYAWKEEQIETLFNDINQEKKGYYVGNILINNVNSKKNIIDGQQRLTTLSLFLLAVYEELKKYTGMAKDENEQMKYEDAKTDIRRNLLNAGEVRLQLLDNDQNVWENITQLNDGNPGVLKRYTLYKRYSYIKEELIGKIDSLENLLIFFGKLSNVELLQISVPDLSDAYQVFASLNSKGLPLTPLDLLKNIYLQRGGEVSYWTDLKDLFKKDDEVQENKLTQFILNNYDGLENYANAQSITKGKVIKVYERLFKEKGADYIHELIKRAQVYIKISNEKAEYKFNLSGLAKLDATTSYPFLLDILMNQEEYKLSDKDIDEIIKVVVKLYVRRNITSIPKASNLRSHMLSIKNYIHNEKLTSKNILEFVTAKIREISPKDELLKASLEEDIYTKNKRTTRFILISLERELGNYFNKNIKDTLDEFTNESGNLKWSIEHILPQGEKLSDYWRAMLSSDNNDNISELQKEYTHLLGNLTLTPYNPELGNRTFKEKVEFKDNGIPVGLKTNLYLNSSINTNNDSWTKNDIVERNKFLTEQVLHVFNI